MNIDNRRLREVQRQIKAYHTLIECSESIEESLIYQGKLECLEKEEKEILERYGVVIDNERKI